MPENALVDSSSFIAAILQLGQELLPEFDWPSDALVGADEKGTSEALDRLRMMLPGILDAVDEEPPPPAVLDVWEAVENYYFAHPGSYFAVHPEWRFPGCCASDDPGLLDDACRFVVGLAAPGQPGAGMSLAELASASGAPLDTLERWLRSQSLV